MPSTVPTPSTPFSAPIAEIALELGLAPDAVLVREADRKLPTAKAPTGSKGKTVFAVTPEDDPFLRGTYINAGWRHRGTEAGDIFWRAF